MSSLLAGLNLPEVAKGLREVYAKEATTQTLIVDLFLLFILVTAGLQVLLWFEGARRAGEMMGAAVLDPPACPRMARMARGANAT